jgi:hypothetical protein
MGVRRTYPLKSSMIAMKHSLMNVGFQRKEQLGSDTTCWRFAAYCYTDWLPCLSALRSPHGIPGGGSYGCTCHCKGKSSRAQEAEKRLNSCHSSLMNVGFQRKEQLGSDTTCWRFAAYCYTSPHGIPGGGSYGCTCHCKGKSSRAQEAEKRNCQQKSLPETPLHFVNSRRATETSRLLRNPTRQHLAGARAAARKRQRKETVNKAWPARC